MSFWTFKTCLSAEISVIYAEHSPEFSGKEVDWIYGDYVISNDQLTAVIAAPLSTRDANLTVRDIGASLLDLTLNTPSNDQLSAFIPLAGRYQFHNPALVETGRDDSGVFWRCRSSRSVAKDGTTATVTYRLNDADAFLTATVKIEGEAAPAIKPYDGVRADKTFVFNDKQSIAFCTDAFFRQTIGFQAAESKTAIQWKKDRPYRLVYSDDGVQRTETNLTWTTKIVPATSPLDLNQSLIGGAMQTLRLDSPLPKFMGQSVLRASIELFDANGAELGTVLTDDNGVAHVRLGKGAYVARIKTIGAPMSETSLEVSDSAGEHALPISGQSGLVAHIKNSDSAPIPTKATIYAVDGEAPDFGPDSTRTFVKNCVYSVHGAFRCPLDPGDYEVYFSHGPEFDRVVHNVTITAGEFQTADITLRRVVDTNGWVSTELHSHSSPSGDNTSDQYGRVENLLCEHLEYAPCTEHNRISSYMPHLEKMGLVDQMATVTGMELTGRPLPVNHQNVFPLHHHPHTQNGGGPRTDTNPVVQIERIAMWDDGSEKLVQQNHPNLHQIFGDLDVDGKPDAGFKGMLQWMDVIEVHPLQTIFEDIASKPPNVREMRIPLFQWMQLLNQGFRIPGVVNTDAHYNHHGSGWLRNWFASTTDVPCEITTTEMVQQAEAGHIVMSTGPFLSVKGVSKAQDRIAIPGDDLKAADGKVSLIVSVQCPNWLDVNRVQVFVNGRPSADHNFTRRLTPDLFEGVDQVKKFSHQFEVALEKDTHLIVATIGEGMTMSKVMGTQYGEIPPIAVSNPIFVDVDGNGFQHNGDELGLPLPREIPDQVDN